MKKNIKIDIVKAVKKADRDANLDNGFKSIDKVFKNKKKYSRKNFFISE
jgi:hypothetical protein